MFERLRSLLFAISGRPASLLGLWERVGDEFAGCLVLVERAGTVVRGRITYAPASMRACGWRVGDVKWQGIQTPGPRMSRLRDLYKELDPRTREVRKTSYEESKMYFVGGDAILVVATDRHRGRRTLWRRVGLPPARGTAEDRRPAGPSAYGTRRSLPLSANRHESMLELALPNDLTALDGLARQCAEFVESEGIPEEVNHRLLLVVEELFVNFVNHGAGIGDRFDISVARDGSMLHVTVQDNGPPFNPLEVASPDVGASLEDRGVGRLGLHLVKSVSGSLSYRRMRGRNVVRLELPFWNP